MNHEDFQGTMCENTAMSKTNPGLKSPPIVEAVLDIECDFAPGSSFVELENAAAARFCDCYPKSRKQSKIEPNSANPVGEGVPSVSAYLFLQDDEKQLVQLRENGYAFNRLAPYDSFDDYLPEIRRTWDIYFELAAPILIRVVKLRYINRIVLPFVSPNLDLDTYFNVGPRMPGEERYSVAGFLNLNQLIEKETGHRITTVLAAEQWEGNKLPVLFDNTVFARIDAPPSDWQSLEATIQSLRKLKNRVFADTLTEKCLSLLR
jgi:uncharacterized protein (TIGR04255 family)